MGKRQVLAFFLFYCCLIVIFVLFFLFVFILVIFKFLLLLFGLFLFFWYGADVFDGVFFEEDGIEFGEIFDVG
jgi:hypothetical protein